MQRDRGKLVRTWAQRNSSAAQLLSSEQRVEPDEGRMVRAHDFGYGRGRLEAPFAG
jgi:hypothetical protein